MAKAARLTGQVPSTTSPSWSTRIRSDARICLKLMPNGLTQKWSVRSGSRAVMWPATPSSKPKRPKIRKAAARRCLRWARSSSGLRSTNGRGGGTGGHGALLGGRLGRSSRRTGKLPRVLDVPGVPPMVRAERHRAAPTSDRADGATEPMDPTGQVHLLLGSPGHPAPTLPASRVGALGPHRRRTRRPPGGGHPHPGVPDDAPRRARPGGGGGADDLDGLLRLCDQGGAVARRGPRPRRRAPAVPPTRPRPSS